MSASDDALLIVENEDFEKKAVMRLACGLPLTDLLKEACRTPTVVVDNNPPSIEGSSGLVDNTEDT